MTNKKIEETFIRESNAIEGIYSEEAFNDALVAWNFIKDEQLADVQWRDVQDVHRILMENLNPKIAGDFRKCSVFIGGKRKKKLPHSMLVRLIYDWSTDYNEIVNVLVKQGIKVTDKLKEKFAKDSHVKFEHIHPFEDGNGRVGRIFYNLHRIKLGLPIHIIYSGEEQLDYYKWFK